MKRYRTKGFSLVELMISTAISMLVISGLVSTFIHMRRAYKALQQMNEMGQNARSAIDMVTRDVRMAGYGLDVPTWEIPSWITWVSGFTTNNPTIVQGASGAPDKIHIAASFEDPVAYLSSASTNGATVLQLGSGEGSQFDTTIKKVVFIGRLETARIVSAAASSITISTDPSVNGKGLVNAYPTGTVVELVKVVTYEWSNDTTTYPGVPHLRRDDNTGSYTYDWQKMVAGNIEDFQLSYSTNSIRVDIRARASALDYKYTDPTYGDHYRRVTLKSYVYPRNFRVDY